MNTCMVQPAANFHQPTFIFASLDTKLRELCDRPRRNILFVSSHSSLKIYDFEQITRLNMDDSLLETLPIHKVRTPELAMSLSLVHWDSTATLPRCTQQHL